MSIERAFARALFCAMAESASDGFETVCSLEALKAAGRKRVSLNGRIVVLFYVSGEVYALDHFCYRELYVARNQAQMNVLWLYTYTLKFLR